MHDTIVPYACSVKPRADEASALFLRGALPILRLASLGGRFFSHPLVMRKTPTPNGGRSFRSPPEAQKKPRSVIVGDFA